MIQSLEQMPLGPRIVALADAIRAIRQRQAADKEEEATYLEMLAQAEATLTPDSGIEPSGLIESNPYGTSVPTDDQAQGDMVDPTTGESSGGAPRGGSGSSPA